jgi:1-aminocyclopropane-1-carboxylate deaminase
VLAQLTEKPVLGVTMGNIALLRLDQTGGLAPGNKHFKLMGNLAAARRLGVNRLVSFGGAWSNHLHALAAVGCEQGFETVGIVRGDDDVAETPMLADARGWGMAIVKVSRTEYRRRLEESYLDEIRSRFAPCLLIPEGGANSEGVRGCMAIADLIRDAAPSGVQRVVLSVGTGTTLAGIAAGLGRDYEIMGISALKSAFDLEQRIEEALESISAPSPAKWRIEHDDHCGGFARVNAGLREFMLEFERVQGIALEPVYTGKMLYAIYRRLASGEWSGGTPLLAIHTGGLQGRRGYSWLQG